ncbi:MAG: Pyrrolo-quinoline quinone [Planctomycetaceae bacterium]|nr:Pyrrolo-quinoline quinone [Planctomycetaceae bacterium]
MQRYILTTALLLTFALSLDAAEIPERYWPRWRGPNDSGSTLQGDFPAKWTEGDGIVWKKKLPGRGYSTPIVWGEQIIMTSVIEGQDVALAVDWDGEILWQTKVGVARRGKHRNGSGSNPSAISDGKNIFVYFKSGNLAALDMSGNLVWKTNLQEKYSRDSLYWDLGTSPVLTDSSVVVAVMHNSGSYVVAYDKQDGDLDWKVDRNYKTPVEGDHSYATPIVMEQNGRQAIIVWGAEHLTAHDAEDGSVIWSCAGFNPDGNRNWVQVASFVISDDVAVVPYGRGSRLAAVKLNGKGDVTATHRQWTRKDTGSFVPTPCALGGKVYVLKDKGQVDCIDAASGSTVFSGQFPKHRMKYYASPTIAGGKMFAPREDGVVLVADVTNGFEFLAENDMGEQIVASPVAIGNRLLIRGAEHLYCIGK